jgi:hypothetical protein
MEQTAQEAVQQASGAGQWNWLQMAALIVSLTTLACIIAFRWWDSRTLLEITFWIDRGFQGLRPLCRL